jgi:hypothetical protein
MFVYVTQRPTGDYDDTNTIITTTTTTNNNNSNNSMIIRMWSSSQEFLAIDPEAPGSIPGPTRFSGEPG